MAGRTVVEMGVLLCVLVTESEVVKAAVGYEFLLLLKIRLRRCQNRSIEVSQNAMRICSLIEECDCFNISSFFCF